MIDLSSHWMVQNIRLLVSVRGLSADRFQLTLDGAKD